MAYKITMLAKNLQNANQLLAYGISQDCALETFTQVNESAINGSGRKYTRRAESTHGKKYVMTATYDEAKDMDRGKGILARAILDNNTQDTPLTMTQIARDHKELFGVESGSQTAAVSLRKAGYLVEHEA